MRPLLRPLLSARSTQFVLRASIKHKHPVFLELHIRNLRRPPPVHRCFSTEPSNGSKPSPPRDEAHRPLPDPTEMKNLPSQIESRRSTVSKTISGKVDDFQTALFTAGQRLNEVTGYSGIEELKKSIEQQELNVKSRRAAVRAAKEAYQSAISRRSASQREVNELLQRKHAWSPTDLERFTELYRSDHANEQEEIRAQEDLAREEREAEEAQTALGRSILARYHEEQIWSDKIRRASTWGTWGLLGFNVLLFIVVQLGLEPWRRRRLVRGFEEKVRAVIQEEEMRGALLRGVPSETDVGVVPAEEVQPGFVSAVEEVTEAESMAEEAVGAENEGLEGAEAEAAESAAFMEAEKAVDEVVEEEVAAEEAAAAAAAKRERPYGVEMLTEWLEEQFAETDVVIKQRDLTVVILESAGCGAFVTALAWLVFSSR